MVQLTLMPGTNESLGALGESIVGLQCLSDQRNFFVPAFEYETIPPKTLHPTMSYTVEVSFGRQLMIPLYH